MSMERYADRRGREAVAAQLLGDRPDLARRDALHVHRRRYRHQGPFSSAHSARPARSRTDPTGPDAKLQATDPGHQFALIIARTLAQTTRRPLTLLGLQCLHHLSLEYLLHHGLQQRT